MNEKINEIVNIIGQLPYCGRKCEGCIVKECPYVDDAESVYTSHVKTLEDALAKAEADRAELVEALEHTTTILCTINDKMPGGLHYKKYEPVANDALMKAHAALASVKESANE